MSKMGKILVKWKICRVGSLHCMLACTHWGLLDRSCVLGAGWRLLGPHERFDGGPLCTAWAAWAELMEISRITGNQIVWNTDYQSLLGSDWGSL